MKWPIRVFILPGYLVLCLLLGGSSSANWGNVALQLLALPIIFWALAARGLPDISPAGRNLLLILCALVVLIALQLMPLPPELWTKLPGRESVARSYELMGQPLPWLPLSLAPYKTVASAMWLLPPVAILLSVVKVRADRPALLGWVMISVVIAAVLLGIPQIKSGTGYIYEIPNYGMLTGFFSNSNHMAILLVVTVPFVAAIYSCVRARRSSRKYPIALALIMVVISVCLVGLLMTGSLASFAIMVPVIGSSLLMIVPGRLRTPRRLWLLIATLGAIATGLVLMPSSGSDLTEAKAASYQLSRSYAWRRSVSAVFDFAPVGSGLGTFVNVYPRYEDSTQVEMTYMNHAHNEYLEVALEMGAAGLVLVAMFFLWWMRRTWFIWRDAERPDVFAQAATIASAAILVHSIVDYPLRMTAISAVFALCCGQMAARRQSDHRSGKQPRSMS